MSVLIISLSACLMILFSSGVYICPTCTVSTGRSSTSEWIISSLYLCTGEPMSPRRRLFSVVFFLLLQKKTIFYSYVLFEDHGHIRCLRTVLSLLVSRERSVLCDVVGYHQTHFAT